MVRFPRLVAVGWALVGALVAVPSAAEAPPATVAIDRAQEALAEGDPGRAARLLEAALPQVARSGEVDAESRVRCLLGAALLRAGSPAAAERALAPVPEGAVCGRRAGFLRAEAMAATERLPEAAALYEALGAVPLGPDRDGLSAEAVAALARKVLADPDRGRDIGLPLLAAALDLRIGPDRAAGLAREIAANAVEGAGALRRFDAACDALLAALADREDRSDRLAAAAACDPDRASILLSALPDDDPEALWLRAALASDPAARDLLQARALGTTTDAGRLAERRHSLALALAGQSDLAALPLLEADGGADALRTRAALLAEAGRRDEALGALTDHLDRFPADPHRAEVAALHAQVLLELGRLAAGDVALAHYDALSAGHPDDALAPTAALEAGYVARAAGDLDGARRRFEELVARWPEAEEATRGIAALARLRAFDGPEPSLEAARDLLRRRSEQWGAQAELDRLASSSLWIESPGRAVRAPSIRLGARNLERVELRVHRIDLEAYARAGGRLEDLESLDVAAIAPDRTLDVPVPAHPPGAEIAFDAPVPVGPGLYALTAASAEEEAKALLLVSDLSVVARAVGQDVAVATFDAAGEPVGRARVVITGPSGTVEGETDTTGLWTGTAPVAPALVLAERRGSWAATRLDLPGASSQAGHTVDAELDRAVVLPGDRVGVRAIARDERGEPRVGAWTVWIDGGEPVDVQTDARGILVADLAVHEVGLDAYTRGRPRLERLVVRGVPPGSADPVELGTVQCAPRDRAGRTLTGRIDGADAVFRVLGTLGDPVAGVDVASGDRVAQTDARGEVRFSGPPLGVPWVADAAIVGTSVSALAVRVPPEGRRTHLSSPTPHLRPNEAPTVTVSLSDDGGAPRRGPVELVLSRVVDALAPIPARPDPWIAEPRVGVGGWTSWSGPGPERGVAAVAPHWRATVDVDGEAPAELPTLPEGRWRLRAVPWDGAGDASSLELIVSAQGLRLVGARDTGIGDALSLGASGAAALLTAEGDGLLWAAVRRDGERPGRVEITDRWSGEVTVAATAPDGQVDVHTVHADPALRVAIVAEPDGEGGQRLRATVTDHAGRPARANVSLTAWDVRLEPLVGQPEAIGRPWRHGVAALAGAIGADLWSGAFGDPIAPALLAEAARIREREKARDVTRSGLLSDNALAEAMLGDGLGLAGFGSGAGGSGGLGMGYGSGGGVLGGRASGRILELRGLPGVRERVLWSVADTDEDGVITAQLAGPAAQYRVRVTALAGTAVGAAERVVDLSERVWWLVRAPEPGLPGDEAVPTATVVNGRREPAAVAVRRSDGAEDRLSLDPGEARTVHLGDPVRSGAAPVGLTLTAGDRGVAEARWAFPLAEGPPDPAGSLIVWARGAGGAAPTAEIALRPDPAVVLAPWRAAVAGRAALAALRADPSDRRLREAVEAARAVARGATAPTAAEQAEVVRFLAEARRAGFAVPAPSVGALVDAMSPPQSAVDRAAVVLARLDAGAPLDRNLVELVELDGRAAAPAAETVAALIALGRPPSGSGAEAPTIAAARAAGRPVDPAAVRALREAGPPPPGDPWLPAWIAAVSEPLPWRGGDGTPGGSGVAEVGAEIPAGAWSWRARSPGAPGAPRPLAARVPADGDARPILAPLDREEAACDPCRVAVGEWVSVEPLADVPPDAAVPLGTATGLALRWEEPGRPWFEAAIPGRFTVVGAARDGDVAGPLVVEVVRPPAAELSPLAPAIQVEVVRDAVSARRRPAIPDLGPAHTAALAELALEDALQGDDDAQIAAAFRTLATTSPQADVSLDDVARAARAMRAIGDPEAAIRAWRAGLDAAFAAEAAGLSQVEEHAGLLVAVQRAREAALRYPDGPATGEALYLLPARLLDLADQGLPAEIGKAGITATDVRLTAAAWDREFLAYYPNHARAASSGLRLARVLLSLGAPEPAAAWAARVGAANPDAPLRDGLVYLEALARTESGETAAAQRLLDRLVYAPFAGPDGVPAPSVHRGDAQVVLGRLLEARGQIDRALAAYEAAQGSPEAERARLALQTPALAAPAAVRLDPGARAELALEVTNLDTVRIRAYAVDLRTLFLRDGGLGAAHDVAVAGVSPAWSGERKLGVGVFPTRRTVALPLDGPGAWLVQLEGAGLVTSTLIVRSGLALAATDTASGRRVAVRRSGSPAAGVEVRALAGGQIVPAITDVRGVAEVPSGAAVLAWEGTHWAFTDPDAGSAATASPAAVTPADERGLAPLLEQLDQRVRARQSEDAEQYRQRFGHADEVLQLDSL